MDTITIIAFLAMEDELCKSAHKVFKIKYHFVFCIKYRKDLFLNENYVECFRRTCEGISKRYNVELETIGFGGDHVHLIIKSIPSYSPSKIFRVVKSITTIRLFKGYPDLKKELWNDEFWSDGGFGGTVGEGVNGNIIRNYIKN